jgi:hypothetical protein
VSIIRLSVVCIVSGYRSKYRSSVSSYDGGSKIITRPYPTQLHRFISRQFMISNILNFIHSLSLFRQLVRLLYSVLYYYNVFIIYDTHRVMHRPTIAYSAINEFICTSISMFTKPFQNDFVSRVGQNCVSGRIRMKFIKTIFS